MKYYVYHAYGLSGELLYVGKGSGDRYKHCNSGVSSNFELNKYYFENGKGSIVVEIVERFSCELSALTCENDHIKKLKPLFNKVLSVQEALTDHEKLSKGLLINFKQLANKYYEAVQCNDVQTIHLISQQCPRLVDYVEELGVETLRTCGFQESKVKRKFNASVGASKLIESPKKIQKTLKFNIGDRYTLRDIKESLSKAYANLNVTKVAKAKDIEHYYVVKRTNIDGANGYKIVGEV